MSSFFFFFFFFIFLLSLAFIAFPRCFILSRLASARMIRRHTTCTSKILRRSCHNAERTLWIVFLSLSRETRLISVPSVNNDQSTPNETHNFHLDCTIRRVSCARSFVMEHSMSKDI